jgi:DNA polymerase phi
LKLSTIHAACETRPEIAVTVYKSLVEYSTKFDRLSKSKTVESLLSVPQEATLSGIITFLTNKIISPGETADVERRWYADQLSILLRQHMQSSLLFEKSLQFLCRYGFFIHSTLSKKDQEMLCEKLFSLLALRISDSSEVWPSLAVLEIEKLEKEHKKVIKLDSKIKKICKAGIKRMKKLRSNVPPPSKNLDQVADVQRIKGKATEQARGLEILFSLTLLQLYNGDPEAVSVLQELERVKVEENSGLLVEIILGFLAKPSVLLRKLSEQVFAAFAGGLTSDGLKLLLDVLLTPETVSGAEELFDHEVGEGEGADQEEDSDDKEDEHDHEDEEDDENEDEDDQEEEDEDIEMSEDGEADEELDAALSAALGTTKPTNNGTTADSNNKEDSSSEELMNDEEMMALDESLATIFRQRIKSGTKKGQQRETKQQISTFKCKVINLLNILIKHPSPLVLETLLPLLQVLRITKSEAVHTKTLAVLRKLARIKEVPDFGGDWAGLMRKIHRDAERARGKDGNVHSQLSIFVARIARKRGEEEEVVGVYAETMRNWIKNGKSMVRAGLFAEWLNWCQSIRR